MRIRGGRRTVAAIAVTLTMILIVGGVAWARRGPAHPAIIVGATDETTSTPPTEPPTIPPPTAPPESIQQSLLTPGPPVGLKVANGQPFPPAINFTSSIPIPEDLVFVLVLGSDARPNEDLLATRADSIHLVAINPRSGEGTVVGFPRDAYVEFPRGGRGKINDALARGGPNYVAETVRKVTGLPVHYWVLTGFVGLQKMVDDLGGVDVYVDRRMNDKNSGARFQPGWHHFVGGEALAYSRDRGDVEDGDFTRSLHQGNVLLSALAKMRSEVGDDGGLLHWLDVMRKYVKFELPAGELPKVAALARRTDPARLKNVVLPGRIGYAGKASVVYLTEDAPRLFNDLRDDAVIGAASPPTTTTPPATTPPPSTTTSTAPPPETTTTRPLGII
jgi:polyisoprenyl-teichoic acid--peptidoglycan teichoic acid transferase